MQWYTWLIVIGWPIVAALFVALVVGGNRKPTPVQGSYSEPDTVRETADEMFWRTGGGA